jgi:chromosome segregation ATPase
MKLQDPRTRLLGGRQSSASPFVQQPAGRSSTNFSTQTPTINSGGYFAQQRHDLLWMSFGVYIGLCVLSFIIKGFNKLHEVAEQTATAARLAEVTRELTNANNVMDAITAERNATIESIEEKNKAIGIKNQRIRVLEVNVTRLEQDVDATRSIADARQNEVSRLARMNEDSERVIRDHRNDLRSQAVQLDQDCEQFRFLQQQAAESDGVIRELRDQLATRPTRERVAGLEAQATRLQAELSRRTLAQNQAEEELRLVQHQDEENMRHIRREFEVELEQETTRLTSMLAKLEDDIKKTRADVVQRVQERDFAREQFAFVQQQLLEQVGPRS